MNKYILLSFAVMGLAFYELSGGADFVPRKAELIAATRAAEAVAATERAARLAAEQAKPAETVTAATSLPAGDSTSQAAAPQVKVTLRTQAPTPKPQQAQAVAEAPASDGTPPAVTLVSLEQSGVLFARPLNQLAEQGPAPTQPGVVLAPSRAADFRSVTGTRVNMRSGPGTDFAVLASLTEGARVEVLADDGIGWIQLRTEDGQIGWMADYLLSPPAG